ncbi:MAG: diaminopimelate decarboxylase family protein [Promethearchaeota archaeon]
MKNISGNPYLTKKGEKVFIDSTPLDEIVRNYETPLLIFMENRIRANISTFLSIFKEQFENFSCFYSFKANFLPEICKIISNEGIGAEVVSLPELRLALKTGFLPNNVIVGAPYLPNDLIEYSIKNNVDEMIIYNIGDLRKINTIAEKYDQIQKICIRVNSGKFDSKLGIKFDKDKIELLVQSLKSYKNIKISSILSHFGTQMNDVNQFRNNVKSLILNLKLLSNHSVIIENINLGGGFPEASVMPHKQLKKIAQMMKNELIESNIIFKKIICEPGRYFVGDSGLYLTKIVNLNDNRWIFLDIGNHICPKFARCSLRFYNASQINEPHKYKTCIAGIVPTDQDVLAKNYFFTENPKVEDNVLVTNVGAYCVTFSNRFPYLLPGIIIIDGDKVIQIFDPVDDHDFSIK